MGGKRRGAPRTGTIRQRRQGEAGRGPALAPLVDPVGMMAELPRRGGIADCGLSMQEQGQAGSLDQALLATGPADEALQSGHVRRAHLGVIGGPGKRHGVPPSLTAYTSSPAPHKLMRRIT